MVLYIGSVGCMILGVVYICSALYDCLGGYIFWSMEVEEMLYQGSDEGINSIWICMGECFTTE